MRAGAQPLVTVRNGKGGRFRVAPAHPELVDAFRSVSHRSPSDKVLIGRGGKRLSTSITTTDERAASGKLRSARTAATVARCTFTKGMGQRQASHPKCVVVILEVWPESHSPGFVLRQADVLQSYTA